MIVGDGGPFSSQAFDLCACVRLRDATSIRQGCHPADGSRKLAKVAGPLSVGGSRKSYVERPRLRIEPYIRRVEPGMPLQLILDVGLDIFRPRTQRGQNERPQIDARE